MNYLKLLAVVISLSSCALLPGPADKQQPIWIDVRTATEYQSGHINEAVNIPHQEIGDRITEIAGGKDVEIHLYCGSGGRAEIARGILADLGYSNVTNDGGYNDILKTQTGVGDK